jgi:hypothetical protein
MRQLIPVAAITSFALLGSVHAAPEVLGTEVTADPRTGEPQVRVTIAGASDEPDKAFALRDLVEPRAENRRAMKLERYGEGDEPLAIAVVYNGGEVWVGNDEFETDENARYLGALHGVAAALETIHARTLPAGSQGTLISYDDRALVHVPLGPVHDLGAQAVGVQRDYRGRLGTSLVAGIELGMAELEKSRLPIKALIVIGDGNDTNPEAARAQLVALKKRAAEAHIRTFAVIYKGALSDPSNTIVAMIPQAQIVASTDGMAAAVDHDVDLVTDRVYATFDGSDLTWDGREHGIVVSVAGEDLEPEFLPTHQVATSTPWFRWHYLQQLGAGLGLALLLVAGMRLTARYRTVV